MIPPDDHHPTANLDDQTLFAELGRLYSTRLDTLRYGADAAWQNSDRRMAELEGEYLKRYPEREISSRRQRPGGSSGA